MVELMCPGCLDTIDVGQPYCASCLLIPVPRPEPEEAAEEPAVEPTAVGSTVDAERAAPVDARPAGGSTCADPDCVHSGAVPAAGCRHCGLRPAATPAAASAARPGGGTPVLLFPWGAVTLTAGRALRIGREDSPLVTELTAYPNVSRRHAEITARDNVVTVIDLDSANGTFVNDRRIATGEPVRVRPGDQIRFASTLVARVE